MTTPLPVMEINVTSALGGGPKAMADLVGGLPPDRFAPIVVTPDDGPYFERYRAEGVPTVDLPMRSLRPATLASLFLACGQRNPGDSASRRGGS